jgi:hypothetical protein
VARIVATRRISDSPPTLVTLGCATSTAPASTRARNPNAVDSFSPPAIGTEVAARTRASPAKSSGGHTGSSSQRRPSGSSRRAIAMASSTDQGQFVSSMSATSSPTASRATATDATSV